MTPPALTNIKYLPCCFGEFDECKIKGKGCIHKKKCQSEQEPMTPPAPQECNHSSVCRFRFVHDPPCYDLTCHSYSHPAPSPDALKVIDMVWSRASLIAKGEEDGNEYSGTSLKVELSGYNSLRSILEDIKRQLPKQQQERPCQ